MQQPLVKLSEGVARARPLGAQNTLVVRQLGRVHATERPRQAGLLPLLERSYHPSEAGPVERVRQAQLPGLARVAAEHPKNVVAAVAPLLVVLVALRLFVAAVAIAR